jgi:hypothetical protein
MWGLGHSTGRRGFDSISNLKQIQIILKFFQALTNRKMTFPSSKNLKSNTVMKDLKKETTFSIGTSSDSK